MKLNSPRKLKSKIKSPKSLSAAFLILKKKNKKIKIVFTNGCFDLLHSGHVSYLEQARLKGDLLVVALNSDASVKKIKGDSRPINILADRLEVMAALECIDFVTWFEEDTPLHLIQLLKPTVLVKGGDWKVSQMIGGAEVLSWGGKVISLPYREGKSTTSLIEKAKTN